MNNLTVIRKTEYSGYKIYIMNYKKMFQYIFANKEGEIFQDHVFLNQTILNIIKFRLNLISVPYSKEELEWVEDLVLSGAIKTIDALKEEKK